MPTPEEITRHDYDEPSGDETAWVDGALPETGIEVVEPDPAWPWTFSQVAELIRTVLGDRALAVEHVGSTAVPGLPAKPVIDVDLTVADPADEDAWLPELESVGFELRIREPWWHEHRALRLDQPRANLHVFGPDSPELVRHRIFRDWLTEHPEDRDRYRDAKVGAATAVNEAGEHVMDYNARKESVVREIYDRAFRALGLLD